MRDTKNHTTVLAIKCRPERQHSWRGAFIALTPVRLFLAGLYVLPTSGYSLDVADTPLLLQSSVPPNIMMMLDNSGSMQNILPEAPYDTDTVYLAACPTANQVDPASLVDTIIVDSQPNISINGETFIPGIATDQKCFNSALTYSARLYADTGINYGSAKYTGNYLNWYFDKDNTTPAWDAGQGKKPGTFSRMEIAKQSAEEVVDSFSNVRLGLASYNYNNGGTLNSIVETLTEAKKTSIKAAINSLIADSYTPLAETLSDIGRYFSLGGSGSLSVFPGTPQEASHSYDSLFTSRSLDNQSGVSTLPAPVQYSCQKNFALLLTDGEPSEDQDISATFADYDGDCSGSNSASCGDYDKKNSTSYIESGSDYLDDVAHALNDIDLRPDLVDPHGERNNLITHTIGFADPLLLEHPLMPQTASQGGGQFYTAENSTELVEAMKNAVQNLLQTVGSASSVAGNSTRLNADSSIYQASFDSGEWNGDLVAFDLSTGNIGGELWKASEELPDHSLRNLYTWSGSAGSEFLYAQLTTGQKAALGSAEVVNYLRGDDTLEVKNTGPYRSRTTPLGDIISSGALYVGAESYGYKNLPGDSGGTYAAYVQEKKSKPGMVYVGANDGILHGFDALTGEEMLGFIPDEVISVGDLVDLSSPSYVHRYFLDGSPNAGDAYIDRGDGDEWGTFLSGAMGAGGRAVFTLDVSDPHDFDEDDVMWEFTDPDLGLTFSQPTIARMETGDWAVIFGNGYDSNNDRAWLFVLDLETGALIRKIDTGAGSSSAENGLATPTLLDQDGNGSIDTAYAGDLLGNVWKFDLSSDSLASSWEVSFSSSGTPQPLFQAKDSGGLAQPITSAIEIGESPMGGLGYMLSFGTGSFFRNSDHQNTDVQTLYGIWDDGSRVATTDRSELQQQSILAETTSGDRELRVTSDNDVNWSVKRGWYMDLTSQERVVSTPLLRHGRAVFTTMKPTSNPCDFDGESWLMEIDTNTGSRPGYATLDLDGDLEFDSDDFVTVIIGGEEIDVAISGMKYNEGVVSTPFVLSDGDIEYKLASGSTGGVDVIAEKGNPSDPRKSWRELY